MMMSLEALMLILPDPLTVMSLPSMTMVPSFFIEIVADPHFRTIDSPASITMFFATLTDPESPMSTLLLLPTFSDRAPPTSVASSAAIFALRAAPTSKLCAAPIFTV